MVELESPRDLAKRSGWPERRIRVLIAQKRLRHIRIGTNIYLPAGALEEFIDANMVGPSGAAAGEVLA